jgi:hypothetical protein
MDLDDVACGIVEENLMPAVHRPLAVVGIGDVLLLKPPFESFNIIGAEGDVAAFKRIDDVVGAEADAKICRGQMHLSLAISQESSRNSLPRQVDEFALNPVGVGEEDCVIAVSVSWIVGWGIEHRGTHFDQQPMQVIDVDTAVSVQST